ncbi:hypothetical protein PR002_g6102 [Phytophthora rubi]|uniref:Uncharacterized protein n=1 Tax=Phytophthora rubi TaxID=129364 RepID=A0A6A3MYM3_9STRA|nr:hypothetical protein PR002_g6102 [Phytophthora rubi]
MVVCGDSFNTSVALCIADVVLGRKEQCSSVKLALIKM